ncbi:MAG TPA: DUF4129 domain-containing protein [Egibacteraceae bacterium]|nr:DUF4129 domain-containing protein [Egibacteraceae bacterium]
MPALLAELPIPQTDPDEVRRIAQEVLARPEYRWETTFRERVWTWFSEQLLRIVDAISGTGQARLIGTAVIVAAAAVVLWLTYRFGRTVRAAPGVRPGIEGPVGRSAAEWRQEAVGHEGAGRWRDAVRCRYRALLAELAVDRIVDERPGRTAGEYVAEVRVRAPAAAEPFEAVTETFQIAWYGHGAVGAADSARLVAESERTATAARARTWSAPPDRTRDAAGVA